MTRSIIIPALVFSLFVLQPLAQAQSSAAKSQQEESTTLKIIQSEGTFDLNNQPKSRALQKPKFGLVVQTARVGATATSVGSELGPYLANFSNNRHMEPHFYLDQITGVYDISDAGLAKFKSDLNHFMFGPAPLSVSELPHMNPAPTYQSASNDPVTIVQSLGVGTQFSIEDAKGYTYDITPSVNLFGDMPILSLNISNGLFKKNKKKK